jgi:hypothetical protein
VRSDAPSECATLVRVEAAPDAAFPAVAGDEDASAWVPDVSLPLAREWLLSSCKGGHGCSEVLKRPLDAGAGCLF